MVSTMCHIFLHTMSWKSSYQIFSLGRFLWYDRVQSITSLEASSCLRPVRVWRWDRVVGQWQLQGASEVSEARAAGTSEPFLASCSSRPPAARLGGPLPMRVPHFPCCCRIMSRGCRSWLCGNPPKKQINKTKGERWTKRAGCVGPTDFSICLELSVFGLRNDSTRQHLGTHPVCIHDTVGYTLIEQVESNMR